MKELILLITLAGSSSRASGSGVFLERTRPGRASTPRGGSGGSAMEARNHLSARKTRLELRATDSARR